MKRPTKKSVRAALEQLGGSPKEVATSLKRRRIKGIICDAGDCPVAKYLKREFKIQFEVSSHGVMFNAAHPYRWERIKMPDPAISFIKAFDDRAYPEMVSR